MDNPGTALEKYGVSLLGFLLLLSLYWTSHYNYLLFHSLAELFSIVVASGIFMLAWNTRQFTSGHYLVFLGTAYLFVAGLDTLHMLAYQGMGVFQDNGPNLATQLWIAARYIESISLLFFPFVLDRKLDMRWVVVVYAGFSGLLLASIFVWDVFPDCYVEGIGLTGFKRFSEYLISLMLVVAIVLVLRQRTRFNERVLRTLVWSLITTIGAELAFTFYVDVYGFSNLVGHFLKIVSFYLIYKAIIETGLENPYHILFRDLKQSEMALQRRTVELQARNEELDAFAQTVAHDLKNPLSLVLGFAETLLEDGDLILRAEARRYLQIIADSGNRMRRIIDGLLLLAEASRADVPMTCLDMTQIVGEACKQLAHLIENEQIEIIVPDKLPTALGYAPWVEAVWVNYISNAIKYGGRPARVELGARADLTGKVRFWVRDNGKGLTAEEQTQLFKPFARLHQDHGTGHGLGLSIVKRILERLGGHVEVESTVDVGSTFSFTLPACREPDA